LTWQAIGILIVGGYGKDSSGNATGVGGAITFGAGLNSGNGGALTLSSGAGATAVAGYTSGAVVLNTASMAVNGSNSGAILLQPGSAGSSPVNSGAALTLSGVTSSTGGTASFVGGTGGTNIAGGALTVTGGAGNGTGVGGAVTITGGAAGVSNVSGGNLVLNGGAGGGTGTPGNVLLASVRGNVGIGTTTPAWGLQIASNTPTFVMSNRLGGTNAKHWLMSVSGDKFMIGTSSDSYSATSTYIVISNGGNIGIGTSSPYSMLSVAGQIVGQSFVATSTSDISSFQQLLVNSSTTLQNFTALNSTTTNSTSTSFNSTTLTATNGTITNLIGTLATITNATSTSLAVTGNSTSTFNKGIDIAGGCFAIAGTCLNVGSGHTGTGSVGQVTFWTSSSALSGDNSFFFDSSAKTLGIGTSTPFWSLQIASSTKSQLSLTDPSAGTNAKHWTMRSVGGNFYMGTTSDALTASSTYLTVLNGGFFGLGTTTPGERFSVSGRALVGTLTSHTSAYSSLDSQTSNILEIGNDVLTASATANQGVLNMSNNLSNASGLVGQIMFSNINSGTSDKRIAQMSAQLDGSLSSGRYSFLTTYGGTMTEKMVINSIGNIGVGTSTPNWLLQISSSTIPQFALTDPSAGTDAKHFFFRSAGGNLYIGSSTDSLSATSTYMTILNGGNVGVGTTTPRAKVTVSANSPSYEGFSAYNFDSSNGGASFDVFNNLGTSGNFRAYASGVNYGLGDTVGFGSTKAINIFSDGSLASGGTNYVAIRTGGYQAQNERLRVDSIGRIGIGTTTPNWMLQLATSTIPQLALSDGSLTSNHWTMRNAGGLLYIASSSASTYATATSPLLTLDSNTGNVAIGTSTPNFPLQVIARNGYAAVLTDPFGVDVIIILELLIDDTTGTIAP
jgi:hypothetical protein